MTKLETALINCFKLILNNELTAEQCRGVARGALACVESTPAKKTKAAPVEQPTKVIDGVTWYGKMVNYTTGPQMAYSTIKDEGKPRKFSKLMTLVIAGRAAGDFQHGPLPIVKDLSYLGAWTEPKKDKNVA